MDVLYVHIHITAVTTIVPYSNKVLSKASNESSIKLKQSLILKDTWGINLWSNGVFKDG